MIFVQHMSNGRNQLRATAGLSASAELLVQTVSVCPMPVYSATLSDGIILVLSSTAVTKFLEVPPKLGR